MEGMISVSVREYLSTSYDPACEYFAGVLVPKPMPTANHSSVQSILLFPLRLRFPEFWRAPN